MGNVIKGTAPGAEKKSYNNDKLAGDSRATYAALARPSLPLPD